MTTAEVENLIVRVTAEVEQYHAKMREVEKRNEEFAKGVERQNERLRKTSFFSSYDDLNKWSDSWYKVSQRFGQTVAKMGADLDYHIYRRLMHYGSQFAGSRMGNFLFGGFQSSPMYLASAGIGAATTYGALAVRSEERDLDRYNAEGSVYDSQLGRRLSSREARAKALTDSMTPGDRLAALKAELDIKQREASTRSGGIDSLDDQIRRQKNQIPDWAKSLVGPGMGVFDNVMGADSRGALAEGVRATPFGAEQRVELERLEAERKKLIADQGKTQEEILRRQEEIAELEKTTNNARTIYSNKYVQDLNKEAALLGKRNYEAKLYDMQVLGFSQQRIEDFRLSEKSLETEAAILKIKREIAAVGMTSDQAAAFGFDPDGSNPEGAARVQGAALRLSARKTQEEFLSPLEKYQKRVADLSKQNSTGLLTQDAYNRALEAARKQYNAAASAAYGFANAIGHVQALSGGSSAGVAAVQNYRSSLDTSRFDFTMPNAVPNGRIVTNPTGGVGSGMDATTLLTKMTEYLRIIAKQPQVTLQPAGG